MAERRLKFEYKEYLNTKNAIPYIKNIIINDTNFFEWKITILPNAPPFNVASFDIVMTLHRM